MSSVAAKTAELINMLPESEQDLAYELVKRLIDSFHKAFVYNLLFPADSVHFIAIFMCAASVL